LGLGKALLPAPDTDQRASAVHEGFALISPVVAHDMDFVDGEAFVVGGLLTGHAFGPPAPSDSLFIGDLGDPKVRESRHHRHIVAGIQLHGLVVGIVDELSCLVLVKLLAAVADDSDSNARPDLRDDP
jgi:hypothetical protein